MTPKLDINENFIPENCANSAGPVVTYGAGQTSRTLYEALDGTGYFVSGASYSIAVHPPSPNLWDPKGLRPITGPWWLLHHSRRLRWLGRWWRPQHPHADPRSWCRQRRSDEGRPAERNLCDCQPVPESGGFLCLARWWRRYLWCSHRNHLQAPQGP